MNRTVPADGEAVLVVRLFQIVAPGALPLAIAGTESDPVTVSVP